MQAPVVTQGFDFGRGGETMGINHYVNSRCSSCQQAEFLYPQTDQISGGEAAERQRSVSILLWKGVENETKALELY